MLSRCESVTQIAHANKEDSRLAKLTLRRAPWPLRSEPTQSHSVQNVMCGDSIMFAYIDL